MTGTVAGIDIGGTKLSAVAVTPGGTQLAAVGTRAATHRGGSAVLAQVVELVHDLELRAGHVTAVGVGAAGVIDETDGVVLAASTVFRDWVGRAIATELGEALQRPVRVANDVNAFLAGELRWGALQDARDALGIMLGTGVGGAVAMDGVVLPGRHGGMGEIGHTPSYSAHRCTCGGIGHLETMTSGRSLGLRYGERAGTPPPTGREVARRARAGDPHAMAVMDDAGVALANAILSATTLLDIGHVVVGGGVAASWDLLQPRLEANIAANPPVTGRPLAIRRTQLDNTALGAASLALDALPVHASPHETLEAR